MENSISRLAPTITRASHGGGTRIPVWKKRTHRQRGAIVRETVKDYPSALRPALFSICCDTATQPSLLSPPRWKFRANEGQAAIKGPQLKRRACNVKQPCAPIVLHQFVSPFIPLRFTILFCFLSFRENLENLLLVIVPDLRISGLELYTFFIAFSFAILDPELWIYNGYFFEKKGRERKEKLSNSFYFSFPNDWKYLGRVFRFCSTATSRMNRYGHRW